MRLTLASMLSVTVPTALVVGGAGAYPTWMLAGWQGLWAQAAAAAIVLAVLIASDLVVIHASGKDLSRAYYLFLMFKALRPLVCVGMAAGAWAVWHLPAKALATWILAFYLSTYAVEAVWMLKVRRGPLAAESAGTAGPKGAPC